MHLEKADRLGRLGNGLEMLGLETDAARREASGRKGCDAACCTSHGEGGRSGKKSLVRTPAPPTILRGMDQTTLDTRPLDQTGAGPCVSEPMPLGVFMVTHVPAERASRHSAGSRSWRYRRRSCRRRRRNRSGPSALRRSTFPCGHVIGSGGRCKTGKRGGERTGKGERGNLGLHVRILRFG